MGSEDKQDWMQEAEKAGWTGPQGAEEPEPQWMAEARAAGWNPEGQTAEMQAPPMPAPVAEPEWMAQARAAGWTFPPVPYEPQQPMPMTAAMMPPPAPPGPPAPAQAPQEKPRRGWVVAASAGAAALILGAGAAIVLAVSGGDDKPTLVPPPTQVAGTSTTPKSVTTVIVREKTKTKTRKGGQETTSSASNARPANPPAPTQNVAADRQAIKNVLRRHFQDLVDGNYQRSYSDLTGAVATGSSSWISAQRQDGLYSFSLSVSPQVDGDYATAQIVGFTTRAADSGCHTWSGSWQMQKVAGSWKIAKSNLARGGC